MRESFQECICRHLVARTVHGHWADPNPADGGILPRSGLWYATRFDVYVFAPGGPPQPVCLCHAGKAQKVVQCKPGRSEFAEYFTPDSKPNRRRKRMLLNMGRRKMPAEVVAGAGNAW